MNNNSMKFSNIRFPEHLSLGAIGGPIFSTDIVTTKSGNEQRNIDWLHARNRYNIATSVKNKDDFALIILFFRIHKGRGIGFRFKDWVDYSASGQLIVFSQKGIREYQLIKTYIVQDQMDIRVITKPVLGTVKINIRGNTQYKYNVDYDTGIVTFEEDLPEGLEIKADFEFDVPVRFDTDELKIISMDVQDAAVEIPLIEIL
ncbi:MAG: hypothetical protein K0R73_1349 [Candidatus Midichloriaceae bacterium]|jgi:uncharacterized protein (TIGR02217 family)|nr:hypothetical protein [Candidatus Midichloriaceae bacterium]